MNTTIGPSASVPVQSLAQGSKAAADTAPVAPTAPVVCSHSISRRLSQQLALLTMVILAVLFYCVWWAVSSQINDRNADDLAFRSVVIADIIELEAQAGGEAAVRARITADAAMRANSRLELTYADGRAFYADPPGGARPMQGGHHHSHTFTVQTPSITGGALNAQYTADFSREDAMGRRWAKILMLVTLAGGVLVALATRWRVQVGLKPLQSLAKQTRAMAPDRLGQRLTLDDPADELLPWIQQFNGLMGRLDGAYAQLEGFNADVAHELRTPLTTLMGETELALSRERSPDALRETLSANLEELQRLSALVNDMLFLSQADRGAKARREAPVSLALLTHQVVEFHEAAIDDKQLQVQVDGDATVGVDAPLFKRAVSNLLGNATRFADRGSVVRMVLTQPSGARHVQVMVHNTGPRIDAADMPRLFDRFFRADVSRCCDDGVQHYGLGLAIIAAIARMHGGQPLATSDAGITRVGFSLAADE